MVGARRLLDFRTLRVPRVFEKARKPLCFSPANTSSHPPNLVLPCSNAVIR